MRCPVCDDVDLAISSREGVEIDYCPQCRGVWLDRGELDKIIDRASPMMGGPGAGRDDRQRPRDRDDRSDDRPRRVDERDRWDEDRRDRGYDTRRHRRRSFLDDLFDFD